MPSLMDSTGEYYEQYRLALRKLHEKQFDEAEYILRKLVDKFPDNLKYSEAMLEALFRVGKAENMLNLFGSLLERFRPTDDATYDPVSTHDRRRYSCRFL